MWQGLNWKALVADGAVMTPNEVSRHQRWDAKPGPQKMYTVPVARAWRPAVGARLDRNGLAPEVEAFLRFLAAERSVAPSTHNQALAALVFLYAKARQLAGCAERSTAARSHRLGAGRVGRPQRRGDAQCAGAQVTTRRPCLGSARRWTD